NHFLDQGEPVNAYPDEINPRTASSALRIFAVPAGYIGSGPGLHLRRFEDFTTVHVVNGKLYGPALMRLFPFKLQADTCLLSKGVWKDGDPAGLVLCDNNQRVLHTANQVIASVSDHRI